jgi:hypothetical protein
MVAGLVQRSFALRVTLEALPIVWAQLSNPFHRESTAPASSAVSRSLSRALLRQGALALQCHLNQATNRLRLCLYAVLEAEIRHLLP